MGEMKEKPTLVNQRGKGRTIKGCSSRRPPTTANRCNPLYFGGTGECSVEVDPESRSIGFKSVSGDRAGSHGSHSLILCLSACGESIFAGLQSLGDIGGLGNPTAPDFVTLVPICLVDPAEAGSNGSVNLA